VDLELEVVLMIDLVVQDLRVLMKEAAFSKGEANKKCGHTDPCLSFQ
jgi:hypothetical protein